MIKPGTLALLKLVDKEPFRLVIFLEETVPGKPARCLIVKDYGQDYFSGKIARNMFSQTYCDEILCK